MFITNQFIIMNLTNISTLSHLMDKSSELSKYMPKQSKQEFLNYSPSYNSETLLLETSEIEQKLRFSHNDTRLCPLTSDPSNSKQTSLFEDLSEQFQIKISDTSNSHREHKSKGDRATDVQGLSKHLVCLIKNLQNKLQQMENKQVRNKKEDHKQSSANSFERLAQSILTNSTTSNGKVCNCDKTVQNRQLMSNLLELMLYKSKLQVYKEQNQNMKKEHIKLQVLNQEMKKTVKRLETQNLKLKELLKQYHNFSKKHNHQRIYQEKDKDHLQNQNNNPKLMHSKSSTSISSLDKRLLHQDRQLPQIEEKIIKDLYEKKMYKQQKTCQIYKYAPMTPNPIFHRKTSFDQFLQKTDAKLKDIYGQKINIQNNNLQCISFADTQKTEPKQRKTFQFTTFQQCKSVSPKFGKKNKKLRDIHYKQNYPFNQLLQEEGEVILNNMQNPKQNLQKISTMSSLPDHTQQKDLAFGIKDRFKYTYCSPIKQYPIRSETPSSQHKQFVRS